MPSPTRLVQPPERPLVLYDGQCGFCKTWIARWRKRTGESVDYLPSQEAGVRFPEIPASSYGEAVQLLLPDGSVVAGAEAVARLHALPDGRGVFSWLYRHVPGARAAGESAYRMIARHRPAAAAVTRLFWGASAEQPTYFAASALFVRLLGLCYLAAFLSLWVQVDGLVGSRGILPVSSYLDWIRSQTGTERYWLAPTLCWLSSSDASLHVLCGAGVFASLALIAGVLPVAAAAAAWLLYLSLSVAGQVFLEFQWDLLLLETGLLAILFVPFRWRTRIGLAPPAISLFLLRWLLFRLMFSSGLVKLTSHDPTWRGLTALRYHYQTQPLPPWTAWYAHHSPDWFHTLECATMFAIELAVPFFFFGTRRMRRAALALTLLLQAAIAATGNYAFFNLLTMSLGILLLDDACFPRKWRESARAAAGAAGTSGRFGFGFGFGFGMSRAFLIPAAAVILAVSSVPFLATLGARAVIPRPLVGLYRAVSPLRSANGYGLFAVMTTSRPEIVVEGSEDGQRWLPYEFRWKPGDVARRPAFVAPHQPRLDWQMWFAALGGYEENPWLIQFLGRLLEGSPPVRGLLEKDPFPNAPPRFIRAVVYDYRFTSPSERRRTGAWWERQRRGLYCPVLGVEKGVEPGRE